MLSRIVSLAVFATVGGTLLMPGAAEAGSRWRFLHPGPFFYEPPPRDYYAEEYEEGYYEDERPLTYFDPKYFDPFDDEEPVYIAPKKKKKIVKKAPTTKPVKKSVILSKKKVTSSKTPSVASVEKKAVSSKERKTATAATGISCEKAERIVSGYGFSSVEAATCKGQVYAFKATRSGKAYVIKLSAASGELTEVSKVQ